MTSRPTLLVATIAALATAAAAPALAGPAKPKPKPLHGTFSYTDTTPDPTVVANNDASSHCHDNVPAAPTDVNSHTISVKGPGTLSVVGHNKLDWAMEVRDSKGNVLAGSDGTSPASPEGATVALRKPGTYSIVYCSAEGEPTITADYTFTYR